MARSPLIALTMSRATVRGLWPRLKMRRAVTSSDAATPTNRVLSMMPVLMMPGQMAVTPTPLGPQSARRHWASSRTAALVVQ
jgi:hypothetical protein